MQSLLVYADGSPDNHARLQAALDIARLTNGHITLHINTPLRRFMTMDPFGGSYFLATAFAEAEKDERELIALLSSQLAKDDVPWDCRTSSGIPSEELGTASMLSDLIVMALNHAGTDSSPDAVQLVGDVVLAARCPVLAVPAIAEPLFITGTAMIAWSGTVEAAGALRAAVPLLARAKAVKLVKIVDSPGLFPSTDAARYLSRHGIHAELVERPRDAQGIAVALEDAAQSLHADWIVMGAYGHSRFRETIFGGVTQRFLDSARYPVLLNH